MQAKTYFKSQIKTYVGFIENKKVTENQFPRYRKLIKTSKRILRLLESGKMTPAIFKTFGNNDRWDIARFMKNVMWLCENCKASQGKQRPDRMFFPGEECYCTICNSLLTKRTGGGQNDPFNYTFKRYARKKKE